MSPDLSACAGARAIIRTPVARNLKLAAGYPTASQDLAGGVL
jgi:hypothetical protein